MREEFRNEVNELIKRHEDEIVQIKRSVIENVKETHERIIIKTESYNMYIKDDGDIRVWQHITENMVKCKTLKDAEYLVFSRDITYKDKVCEMINKHAHEITRYESEPLNDNQYYYKFVIEANNDEITIACAEDYVNAVICTKKGNIIGNLYTIESIEKYFFRNKENHDNVSIEEDRKEVACDRISNCNSDWLEKAVAANDIHEVQLELSGLIIDELLRYIDNKDIENAVHERINKLK